MKKKETNWFSHESTCHSSSQMLALIGKYGSAGYGNWWILVEILRQQDDYKYEISKKYSFGALTAATRLSEDEVKAFIHECIHEYDLLQSDGEYIWSDALLERMQHLEEKKAVLRERGRKGGIAKGVSYANKAEEDTCATENNTCAMPSVQKEIAHTVHNSTVQKNSDDDDERNKSISMSNNSSSTPFFNTLKEDTAPVNTLSTQLLQDELGFVAPLCTQFKFNSQRLGEWLNAFNQKLLLEGTTQKTAPDYRRHFLSWLKFQDVWNPPPRAAIKNTIAQPHRNSTMEELRAQRKAEEEEYEIRKAMQRQQNTHTGGC